MKKKEEFDGICKKYGLDLISMIAPTSHARISMIAKEASGFLYCVSSLGVTGTRSQITTDIGAMTKLVKDVTDTPCAIGFGISTPEQAKEMAAHADGVIVGSAIVKLCAKYGKDCVPYIKEYVASMKKCHPITPAASKTPSPRCIVLWNGRIRRGFSAFFCHFSQKIFNI